MVTCSPREASVLAKAAHDDARRRGAEGEAARALHVVGQSLAELGQLIDAGAALSAAEAAARANGDQLTAARCKRDRASVLHWQGDYPAAQRAFEHALLDLEHLDARADSCVCLCWMSIMASFRHLNADALSYLERARALLDPERHPREAAIFLLAEGMFARYLSRFDAAHAALENAATAFEALGEDILLGRALLQQGFLWFARQDYAQTLQAAERALAIFERCESRHFAAMTSELQGKTATSLNQWEQAYRLIDMARAVYVEQDMKVLAAQAGLHRANVDYWLDAWGDAEQGYHAMAETARRYGAYHHLVLAESNLGLLALNRGQHDQALFHTHAALDQATLLERPDDAARCHRQLGNVYGTLQRWPQARFHFERAITLMRQLVQPLDLAQTQTEYADYAHASGDSAGARQLMDQAHAVLVAYGSALFVAENDYRRARLALAEGDLPRAERLARASYAVQTAHESLNEMARLHAVFGGIAEARGQIAEARHEYERAYTLLVRPFPDEAVQVASALGSLWADDPPTALRWYCRAVEVAQHARGLVSSEQLAAELARQSAPALGAALRLAIELDQDETALALAEDARAQVALAWLEGQRRSHSADADTRALAERCWALRSQLEAAEETAHPEHPQPAHLAVLQAEYDDALALWRRFSSDVIPGRTQPFDWERCRAQLNRLHVAWQALAYWLHEDELLIWHGSSDALHTYRRRVTPEERHSLERCCATETRRRSYLYDRDPATLWTTSPSAVHLARTAELLLPPRLAETLTPDTLLAIVPAGLLHALPFSALPLRGKPMVAQATIAVAPSLQLLARLVERGSAPGHATLAIGVPEHDRRDDLPHACAEARMVAEHTRGDAWCAEEATISRLREASTSGALARYRAIHIATHAWAGVARGEQAGIALVDGDLAVADLAQLHLDADVVVLSACESGAALHYAGEEMIGLTYALLQAGTRALVASLWKLDDAVSLELMRRMYEALRDGHRGPWALAHMQRAALAAGYAPFHWAAYLWIGHP